MIKVNVAVQNRPMEENLLIPVVTVNKIGGKASFGKDILPAFTARYPSACHIKIATSNGDWPASGKVLKYSSEGKMSKCSTFNATYIHDGSYIPNVDYIPFAIAWKSKAGQIAVQKLLEI